MHTSYRFQRHVAAIGLSLLLGGAVLSAQDSRDFAVMLHASVSSTPVPTIRLMWNKDPYADGYQIFRKLRTDVDWPAQPRAELDSTVTVFVDTNVSVGVGYEYQVVKHCPRILSDTSVYAYLGYGFIYAGIRRAPETPPGAVLLLVDSTMASPLASELTRLANDLRSEGWRVIRREVGRAPAFDTAAVARVKNVIKAEYAAARYELSSVMLIGRVAVPYSGDINPDGHPDHKGAWPADLYYGDVDGYWTDNRINDSVAGRLENRNVKGDGKFDQSTLPSNVELAVGRVDFYDMPAFAKNETELLRQYLDKDHAYRSGAITVDMAGIIDDNFPASAYLEGFSSAAWRAFPLFGGDTSVTAGDWFTLLGGTRNYLWAYGCGGGSYLSAGGIGTSTDFTTKPINAVFTMLFGSYFGDWDVTNSFFRSSIAASGASLTCAWVARPQWYFHHMALGETIGASTVLSQNNGSTYFPNALYTSNYPQGVVYTAGNRFTHVALLGDPTLRARTGAVPAMTPVTATRDTAASYTVRLQWTPVSGATTGYLVYRTTNRQPRPTLLTLVPLQTTSFVDGDMRDSSARYQVHATAMHATASGDYYSVGAGAVDSIRLLGVDAFVDAEHALTAVPNPAVRSTELSASLRLPARTSLELFDASGRLVRTLLDEQRTSGALRVSWDLNDERGMRVPAGVYVARLRTGDAISAVKVIVTP